MVLTLAAITFWLGFTAWLAQRRYQAGYHDGQMDSALDHVLRESVAKQWRESA